MAIPAVAAFDFWRGWEWVILKTNIFLFWKRTFMPTSIHENQNVDCGPETSVLHEEKISCTHVLRKGLKTSTCTKSAPTRSHQRSNCPKSPKAHANKNPFWKTSLTLHLTAVDWRDGKLSLVPPTCPKSYKNKTTQHKNKQNRKTY